MTDPLVVDLAFRLRGDRVPLDHGYLLYSALSKQLAELHEAGDWGVHPIQGTAIGGGELALTPRSRVVLRIPTARIQAAIPLAGKQLKIGQASCQIGVPEVRPLRPSTHLFSRLVTIKGFEDADQEFLDACHRQLEALDVDGVQVEAKKRRVMDVKGYTVVGFAVRLSGVAHDSSVRIQESGLGGKRKMGAGIFVPIPHGE